MRSLVPVVLFTSAEKTQSKSKYRQFTMVLLAFPCERKYCCWCFIESCLLFVCCCMGRRRFPAILWSKQLVRSCWSASIRTNISLNTFLQNNFSRVHFLRKLVLGLFSHVFYFLFSFSGLWNECEIVPMLMLSLRSDIQAFQKDTIEF